ncbi:hypothetical protein STEG23_032112 [Scotinomys teguina]
MTEHKNCDSGSQEQGSNPPKKQCIGRGCVPVCGAIGGQKRGASEPLELEFTVNCDLSGGTDRSTGLAYRLSSRDRRDTRTTENFQFSPLKPADRPQNGYLSDCGMVYLCNRVMGPT